MGSPKKKGEEIKVLEVQFFSAEILESQINDTCASGYTFIQLVTRLNDAPLAIFKKKETKDDIGG